MPSRIVMAITHAKSSTLGFIRTFQQAPRFACTLLLLRIGYFFSRRVWFPLTDPWGFRIDNPRILVSYWGMWVEPEMRDSEWVRPFQECVAPVAIDVGANAGVFTHLLAHLNPQATIYAFEPLPAMAAQLEARSPSIGAKVIVHGSAVGSDLGQATLFAACDYDTSASLVSVPPGAEPIRVPVVTLDATVPPQPILLLKVDTERYELEVLKGARDTLRRTKFLILEIGNALDLGPIKAFLGPEWRGRRITCADYLFTRATSDATPGSDNSSSTAD